MPLKLEPAANLPSLSTNCVLIGHAEKADVVWTRDDFMALCEHMLNDNESTFFMIPYRRDSDGVACFAKAKKAQAHKRARWAWDTITGQAKQAASIGFYPRNSENKSRWGAMDFDAHNGEGERARTWALNAFQLLRRHPQLFVVLCTSGGGGWHLFVFTNDFHPVVEWTLLLKQAAGMVGATIEKGSCEIFPSEVRGRVGYGIRAPGAWNPKSDAFGMIAYQNVQDSICKRRERDSLFIYRLTNRVKGSEFTYSNESECFRGFNAEWKTLFAITAARTRRDKMKGLVGHIFRQVGHTTARRNIDLQYSEATVTPQATAAENIEEFEELWQWWAAEFLKELSPAERTTYDLLATENERDAFRIVHSFAKGALTDGQHDFMLVCAHLAKCLALSIPGASKIQPWFGPANPAALSRGWQH